MELIFILTLFVLPINSIYLDCTFYDKFFVKPTGDYMYGCMARPLDVAINSTHITGVGGEHVQGSSAHDVLFVKFGRGNCLNANITAVPKGFLNFFPNLIGLSFDSCDINTLRGDELNDYPNLEEWGLTQSKLERIPGSFFTNTPKLTTLNFDSNKLRIVDENLFNNLNNLLFVRFRSNPCINREALTPEEVPALLQEIRMNCKDSEISTCKIEGAIEDHVCEIREDVSDMERDLKKFESEIRELKAWNHEISETIRNQYISLGCLAGIIFALIFFTCAMNLKVTAVKGAMRDSKK